jgi:hypothetical protein
MIAEMQAKIQAEMQAVSRSLPTGLRRRGLRIVKNRKLLLMFFQRIVRWSMCLLRMSPISARFSRTFPQMLRWQLRSGSLTKRQMTREWFSIVVYLCHSIESSNLSTPTQRERWRSGNATTLTAYLAMMQIWDFLRRLTTSQIISGSTLESDPLCAMSPGASSPLPSGLTTTNTWKCMQAHPDSRAAIPGVPNSSIPASILM